MIGEKRAFANSLIQIILSISLIFISLGKINLFLPYELVFLISSFNSDCSSKLYSQMSSCLWSILRWNKNLTLNLCRTTLTEPLFLGPNPPTCPFLSFLICLMVTWSLCHSKWSLGIININLNTSLYFFTVNFINKKTSSKKEK